MKKYLDNDYFENLLKKWQTNTITDVENNELGNIFMKLHQKIANSNCFRRYDYATKQDMISHSLLIIMKSLSNWKYSKGKAFSYFTASCFYNMFAYLKKEKRMREKFEKYKQEIIQFIYDITNYQQLSTDESE